jgi:hypothetical protein
MASATPPGTLVAMASADLAPDLTAADRSRIVESVFGSVRAEGCDPRRVAPDAQAWVAGEITVDELVQRQLEAVAAEHGQPSRPARAA